jgi:O-antigen/teichoic acid export membrane protein
MVTEPDLTINERSVRETPDAGSHDLLDTSAAGPMAIRGSLLRVGGYVVGMLLSVLSVSLLIRHLGVSDYGRYVTVISLVSIVQGVTDVGLGQIGVREFATRTGAEQTRLMRNLLGIRFVLTALGVTVAVAFSAAGGYGTALMLGTLVAGLGMVLTVVQGTFAVPLSAQLRLGWVTAMDFVRQVLTVAAIVGLVLTGATLLAFLSVPVPVALVVLAATMMLVRGTMPLKPAFQRTEWVRLLRGVLPYAGAVALGVIYLRITVVLTSLLASHIQTGYYATSYRVLEVLIAIPGLTVGTALPVLARAARDDQERLRYVLQRLFEITLIVGAWLALALALGADFAVAVLAGGKANPSATVLQIQALALVTQFVMSGWQYGLLSLHRHRPLLGISAGALLISASLTLVLVPRFQAQGAAIAFTAAEIAGAIGSLAVLVRFRPDLRPSLRIPGRVLLAVTGASGAILIPGTTSLSRTVIASAIYFAILVLLRAIPPEILHAVLHRPQSESA